MAVLIRIVKSFSIFLHRTFLFLLYKNIKQIIFDSFWLIEKFLWKRPGSPPFMARWLPDCTATKQYCSASEGSSEGEPQCQVHCVPMLTFSHSSPASLMINQAFQPKSEGLNIHLCNFLEPCLHIKFSRSGLSSFRSGGIGKHKGNLSAWEPCRNSPATALDMEIILSTGQWNILCFKLLHCTLDWNFWFWTSYIFLAGS